MGIKIEELESKINEANQVLKEIKPYLDTARDIVNLAKALKPFLTKETLPWVLDNILSRIQK